MKNIKPPSTFVVLESIDGVSVKDYSQDKINSLWGISILSNEKEVFRVHHQRNMCLVWNILNGERICFKTAFEAIEYIECRILTATDKLLYVLQEMEEEIRECQFLIEMMDEDGNFCFG